MKIDMKEPTQTLFCLGGVTKHNRSHFYRGT